MKLIVLDSHNPYENLAVEEYLFESTEEDIFMLWQNAPTVVIGKNQNAYAEINMSFIKENNVYIARRITGGGAVYHDLGNVNYSFISNAPRDGDIDFARFTSPITAALSAMGIDARLSGRNDLLTVADGKKFSGNAQYKRGERVLHHGTLLFDSDLDALTHALKVDEEKLRSKAIRSTRSRVTNLRPLLSVPMDVEKFISLIAEEVCRLYNAKAAEAPKCSEIDRLAALKERNESEAWIFPERELLSQYYTEKKKRYPFGGVNIYLDMKNDTITDIKIMGDFFGSAKIELLEDIIKGNKLSELSAALADTDTSSFIFGMTRDELCSLICS